jgi:glutathionylspermidine synthase
MVLDCCKWDPQVGDVATLAPFPLLIAAAEWVMLAADAETLAAELMAAEPELLELPHLWRVLAIPRRLRSALRRAEHVTSPRVLRFDFHWTPDGWRISEVNSDVPGGYAEASSFPRLMAGHVPGARPAGDPAIAWTDAFEAAISDGSRHVALLAAAGFMEDLQVVAYLGGLLAARGFMPRIAQPQQLQWLNGRAFLSGQPLGGIVRFYQAEWLARLRRGSWGRLFETTRTPVVNPAAAMLSESKRFPLVWNSLTTAMPTWRRLLPETRDPRHGPWRESSAADAWLIKSAFCNTGDTVAARDLVSPKRWAAACRSAWWFPGQWVAQRRFETLPIDTPTGEAMYPSIGVYTVNGRASGAYSRLSRGPIVDFRAVDAALLVRQPSGDSP